MGAFNTTWIFTPGQGNVYNFRENYRAVINGDGYNVRQFTRDVRGNKYFAYTRCEVVGDPNGYETYGKAILACLEHAGIANKAGRHFVDLGPGQIIDVKF